MTIRILKSKQDSSQSFLNECSGCNSIAEFNSADLIYYKDFYYVHCPNCDTALKEKDSIKQHDR